MTRHATKTRYGQCKCLWCNSFSTRGDDCPVTEEMRIALKQFSQANGRTWKSKLIHEWQLGGSGIDYWIRHPLICLRNIVGPSGLLKISTRMIENVKGPSK